MEVVLIAKPAAIVNVSVREPVRWVGVVESVTVSVTLLEPIVVGVPEIAPVVGAIDSPTGRSDAAHV
jgi:hypothetical protein